MINQRRHTILLDECITHIINKNSIKYSDSKDLLVRSKLFINYVEK